MVKIIWSNDAIADLNAIMRYIAHDSPEFAGLFRINILNRIKSLEKLPRIGRHVPESDDPNDRELIYQSYRIIYRIIKDDISIITIFHSSRQLRF